MAISFDFLSFVYLIGIVLGFLSSAVILFFGFKSHPANQPLGIGQLSVTMVIFLRFSLVSLLIFEWPFLYRTSLIFALIFAPMPYLHVVFYTKKRRWKWYDLLHALPLLIYLVDYWDVLSLSSAQKLILIQSEIDDLNVMGNFNQSKFFGPGFHQEFRSVLLSLYWAAQVVVFTKWLKSQQVLTYENKVWKNWMLVFLSCQFFFWFPFYVSVFWMVDFINFQLLNSISILFLLLTSLSLFFFPSLIYGKPYVGDEGISQFTRTIKKPPISEEEGKKLEEIMQSMEAQMDDNRLFLKTGYTINDFAKEVNIPVYQISKCLNTFKSIGFVDYINQKRINYCVKNFENGEWSNYKVEAIATECGFNNRNSFTNAFKKFLGTTPTEYRENIKI